jgi:Calx-beta domain.
MNLPRHLLAAFFTTIILVGCDTNESSQLKEATYEPASQPNPAEKAEVIGEALGIPQAKPARDSDGQELLGVHSQPLLYSDAGLIVALQGEVTVADGVQISKTLWRQISGPEAQILNATQQQAEVIIPHVAEITDLEFAFAAADSENHVAEARTQVRISPLKYSGVAIKTTTVVSVDKAVITLTLPEVPQSPVTLYYRTQDGTAVAGQNYEAMENRQVTFSENNPDATIEIKILNPGIATEDRYFRVFYSTGSGNPENNFHVVIRRNNSGAPGQPTDPVQPEPNDPSDPNEPTEPTDPTPLPAYNITYSAAEGGRIHGAAQQTLSAGANGSPVTAIANPGYRFVAWSDGLSTATRTATDAKADLQVTAQFRLNQLWLDTGHYGEIIVNAGPTTATIDWPAEPGKTYNVIVADDPETEIQNYSVHGAKLMVGATPPLDIEELTTDQPVYIALLENGELKAWSSFVPRVLGTDGNVRTIAIDSDGSQYIGGGFTQVSPLSGNGVALTSTQNHFTHAIAAPVIDGEVHAAASDGYGGWYVGGSFSKIHGHDQKYLIHINAAGQLIDWDHRIQGSVHAILIDEDVIYVGGSFQITNAADGSRRYLAAFDRQGNLLPWKPEIYQPVLAIAKNNDVIYTAGVADNQNYLSAFDAKGTKLAFNPQVTSQAFRTYIYSIAVMNNNIFIGGNFTEANGEPRKYLAAFDIEGNLLPWDPSPNSAVEALAVDNDILYLGGHFTQIGKESRAHLAALDTQGQILPWNPGLANPGSGVQVKALAAHNGVIYAGGYFSQSNNERRNNLAMFDTDGRLLSWKPGGNSGVNVIAAQDEVVYVGGGFTMIGGGYRSSVAATDKNGRLLPWSPELSGSIFDGLPAVNSVLIDGDIVYIGGIFFKAEEEARHHLAAFDKTGNLLPWAPNIDGVGIVKSLVKTQDIIYVGGLLLWADNRVSYGLEAFDIKGNLQTWAPVIDNEVKSLAVHQGVLYGNKQIFQDGVLIGALEGPENLYINALTVERDFVYAGGQVVPTGGGVGSAALTAFDLQGKQLPWSPQLRGSAMFTASEVHTVAASSKGIYVGGSFTNANGESRGHIASFDAEGDLLPWTTSMNNPVYVLVVHEGVVYAGGAFTKAGDQTRASLATFDLQGNLLNK